MDTLLLDRTLWDLCKNARGNIAVASNPYSIAQDVSSAARLFKGELWYDTTKGIPYFQQVLGHQPPLGLLKKLYSLAALSVPEVVETRVFVSAVAGREIVGQIQSSTRKGALVTVTGPLNLPRPGP